MRQYNDRQAVLDKIPENIAVPQWKRVEIHDRVKKKQVMRITNTNMKRDDFFRSHRYSEERVWRACIYSKNPQIRTLR